MPDDPIEPEDVDDDPEPEPQPAPGVTREEFDALRAELEASTKRFNKAIKKQRTPAPPTPEPVPDVIPSPKPVKRGVLHDILDSVRKPPRKG